MKNSIQDLQLIRGGDALRDGGQQSSVSWGTIEGAVLNASYGTGINAAG